MLKEKGGRCGNRGFVIEKKWQELLVSVTLNRFYRLPVISSAAYDLVLGQEKSSNSKELLSMTTLHDDVGAGK